MESMFAIIPFVLAFVGLLLGLIASYPYVYYILKIRKIPDITFEYKKSELPDITVAINAYKEGELILKRVKDIIDSDYPKDKLTLYIINDGADENTSRFSKEALSLCNFKTKLIEPKTRLGKTVCLNNILNETKDEITVFTDADITTKSDALRLLVETLLSDEKIGAVCAEMVPVGSNSSVTGSETAYRSIYGRMCEYDSFVDSTYNFNGPLIAFKKEAVKYINDKRGADDANLALECIKNGYRAVYRSDSVAYELQPISRKEQFRQKIRRADGLVNSTRLFAFEGRGSQRLFWRRTFPVRKQMLLYSPLLFIFAALFLLSGAFLFSVILGVVLFAALFVLILFSLSNPKNILSTFVLNQMFLIVGLLGRKNVLLWDRVGK